MTLKNNEVKISKIEERDSFLVCFWRIFWSLCVSVGGIVSDYFYFKNDREELLFNLKKFLEHK